MTILRDCALAFPALLLVACSGDPAADAAKVAEYRAAYLPVVAGAFCDAQKAANAAGAIAESSGDVEAAKQASLASVAAGVGCTWDNAAPVKPAG